MNKHQSVDFNIVMTFSNKSENYKPLRMIVAGKSFLIKCLVKSINSLFNSNKSVHVLCPTSKSANLVSGVTLHIFLKVPTDNRGEGRENTRWVHRRGPPGQLYWGSCHPCWRTLFSMVNYTWMDGFPLQMWTGLADQSWVVFLWWIFGDDVQLPPVLDAPVYNTKSYLQLQCMVF